MTIKKILFSLIALALVFFTSCEYNFSNDEHFVEVEQPKGDVDISINISEIPKGETIYLYRATRLYIQVDVNQPIAFVEFSMEDNVLPHYNQGNNYYYVDIDPTLFNTYNEPYPFKISIVLKSNTGSLADILGVEGYMGELTFNIVFLDKEPDILLNISRTKTDDGFLKIMWDKPSFEHLEVLHYSVSGINFYETKEIDGNETCFVDSSYYAQAKDYVIEIHFKNDKIEPAKCFYTAEAATPVDFSYQYEDVSIDKIKVSWTPYEYSCKYVLVNNYSVIQSTLENSMVIDRFVFPENDYYQLVAIPYNEDEERYSYYRDQKHQLDYQAQSLQSTMLPYVYDYDKKVILTLDSDYTDKKTTFRFYDLHSQKEIKSHQVNHYFIGIDCSPYSKAIALTDLDYNVKVYHDDSFTSYTDVPSPSNDVSIDQFKLIGNNRLALSTKKGGVKTLYVFDYEKKEYLYQFSVEAYNEYNIGYFGFSPSGKYCVIRNFSDKKAIFFQLNDTDYTMFYTWNNFDTSCAITFDPLDDETFFVINEYEYNNLRTDIYNISSMSKIDSYIGRYLTTDLYTGNRVRVKQYWFADYYEIIEITDKDGRNALGEIITETHAYPALIDNYLFVYNYYLNLNPYINN